MSLPEVLLCWRDYMADAISDAVGDAAVPDKAIIHHGKLPDDCCTDMGALGVWWDRADLSVQFPVKAVLSTKGELGGAYQLVDLGARFNKCWYVPPEKQIGSDATYARYEDDATTLALIADEVDLALLRLSCGVDEFCPDVVTCEGARWTTTTQDLSGDCAGIEWHLIVGVLAVPGPT